MTLSNLPTSEIINSLPLSVRQYIYHLETMSDPCGLVRDAATNRENALALQQKLVELKQQLKNLMEQSDGKTVSVKDISEIIK